jgi:uncharacterized damage-inducible protein DinB
MDAKEFITIQMGIQRKLADAVLSGLTDEQLNWAPPGTMNTIGTVLLHVTSTDDNFVHGVLGQPTVWDRDNYAETIGLPKPPGRAGYWDEANAATLTLAPILAYVTAVRTAFDAYLAQVTDADLSQIGPSPFGEMPRAGIIGLLVVHSAHHVGEIAALEGIQGGKGLPF